MAKLTILALVLAALVAFATPTTTIVTTPIDDKNPFSEKWECSARVQGGPEDSLDACCMYLEQGQSGQNQQQILHQCCQELQNIEEPCQCDAVRQVYRDVPHSKQSKQKAESLPKICNLHLQQCRIERISSVAESNFDIPFDTKSQQCKEREIQRPVSQCQRFVEQQMRSPRLNQQGSYQPQQRGLQQCCNELQNVRKECQCEAIKEVGRKMMTQQQGGQYGGQQQTQIMGRVLENLPNQCYLEVQQCNVPY